MVRGRHSIIRLLAVLTVSLLAASSVSAGEDASDLAGRAKAWQAAFNSGNPQGIAALYSEDGVRMPYQAPLIQGRAAIAADIQANFDAGVARIVIEVHRSESKGDMAWGHGRYQLKNAEGEVLQQGKWMNVSRKVRNQWLLDCDIWNTDAPESAE